MQNCFRNWSDLRIYLAVMRQGSTLAASRELGIAQPTVARRIDALEHELGLTLFERDTRGFRPTTAGRALLPDAEAVETAAARLAAKVQDLTQTKPVRITGFTANFSTRVNDILSAFSEEFPDVAVELIPSVHVLDLMAGEADVAMRLSWTEQHPDLICRHISTARFTLYGTPAYAEKFGLPKTPKEMKDHRIFTYYREGILTKTHDWVCRYMPQEAIARTYSEVSVLDAAIRSGLGLGVVNLRLAEPEEKAGTLIRCFEPPEELNAKHMVLIPPDAYRRREVRAFAKFFIPRYAAIFA